MAQAMQMDKASIESLNIPQATREAMAFEVIREELGFEPRTGNQPTVENIEITGQKAEFELGTDVPKAVDRNAQDLEAIARRGGADSLADSESVIHEADRILENAEEELELEPLDNEMGM
jgi:hypothetical protein